MRTRLVILIAATLSIALFVVIIVVPVFLEEELAISEGLTASENEDSVINSNDLKSERWDLPMGLEMPDGSLYGNVPGNIAHGGRVNTYEDWIYFGKQSELLDLYRMQFDGSEKAMIEDGEASYISMYDGWMFFIDRESRVCRSRPNGEDRERIGDFYAYDLNIVDGWMYFIKSASSSGYLPGEIWKMRPNGSEAKMLRRDPTEKLVAYDGWLFFTDPKDNDDKNKRVFYRMTIKGDGEQRLSEDMRMYVPAGDWIFYRPLDEDGLYKMKLDGSEAQKVNGSCPMDLNAWGDWVYYIDKENAKTRPVYRVNIESSETQLVSDRNCSIIEIVGSRSIFFREWSGEWGTSIVPEYSKDYLADFDGSKVRMVDETSS